MHRALKEPHLFNAGPNPLKLIKNLSGILLEAELEKIRLEVKHNAVGLFRLGEQHIQFALSLNSDDWRQITSRLYYGVYNIRRAVVLMNDGKFSTDSSDHRDVESIPDSLNNSALHKQKLKDLRDDRNLADYSHVATVGDLLIEISQSPGVAGNFMADARDFLTERGVVL